MNYKEIYRAAFANPSYSTNAGRKYSCSLVHDYITDEKSAIDIGSGKGPVLLELIERIPPEQILSCDLENFHNMKIPFEPLDLTVAEDRDRIVGKYGILTCLDVLEHIEEVYLGDILQFFKRIAKKQFIIVANHSDVQNGVELHLTQKPFQWWEGLFMKFFKITDSKSIHNNRAYVFSLE